MGIIASTNKAATGHRGLRLYHSRQSNCSVRVRMTLEEKGLEWTSHHLNPHTGENVTPAYFGIHPKGLVPTLVHDGVAIIESADINRTLDGQPCLIGDAFTLADITWIPLHVTLDKAGFPFHRYANVARWKDAGRTRPSFRRAVLDWTGGA